MPETNIEIDEETLEVFKMLGSHMPGGFFIYKAGVPEELIYANRPVFEIFGCRDEEEFRELTGYTFRGMVHPEDYERISASIHEQIKSREDHMDHAEYRIIRKDGAVRFVDDYGHYLDSKAYGPIYTVFISDITEKREERESHKAFQQARIDELSESVRKANAERITFSRISQALAKDYFSIYIVDPETDRFIEYSSSKGYDQFNVEKEGEDFFGLSRRNMSRLLYPEDRDRFMRVFTKERIMKSLKNGEIFTMKYRMMMDGAPVYISMKATLLDDEHGTHLIIGSNNIDAQIRREEEYKRSIADAREKAKNEFMANVSHDIRTPMNAIVGYTNIANTHLNEPDTVRDCLEKIGSSSHFLLSMINDVLDYSLIEKGDLELNISDFDLRALLRRIEDITSLQARNKALKIRYDRKKIKHHMVKGDELRIEQSLINIVSNAIKYTPEGGTVEMLAEETEETEPGVNRYRFVVSDTGIGISEDFLPYIFDSFSREKRTTVNEVQGSGLGLAISYKVLKQMGGSISVQSKPGEGSTFTIELDLKKSEVDEVVLPKEDDSEDLIGTRILLAEDNDINAEIAIMVLSRYGIEVERAVNGQECLEMMERNGAGYYSAILMDLQMPLMNGLEAARAIRALDEVYSKEIPIIAISANAHENDIRDSLDAGMDTHIAKPFDPDKLLKTLQRLIRKRKNEEET
jgi:PAS domain S-box-containing protein